MNSRQTHVGIELRLKIEEAEALEAYLLTFIGLIDSRVVSCGNDEQRENLLAAMRNLSGCLSHRAEPFDAIIAGVELAGGVR